MTTTHIIPTDEVISMIADIASDLDLGFDAETSLLDWINDERANRAVVALRNMPVDIPSRRASQAIADIIASCINQADEEDLDAVMQQMMTDEGWQFEQHNMTLWVECSEDHDTLVVWLGNMFDFDMCDLGRAQIAN